MFVSFAHIECNNIHDWTSFHAEFSRVFGFPDFYGQNMDAWIDCMSSLDCADDGMSDIHCEPGKVITIELLNVKPFRVRCPEQYEAIIDCSAFVNWRRIERDEQPVLALSFYA